MKNINFGRTIFVIGAGAHKPYGFPISRDLTEDIKDLYREAKTVDFKTNHIRMKTDVERSKREISRLIKDLRIVDPPVQFDSANSYEIHLNKLFNTFLEAFGKSQLGSIDQFLAKLDKDSPQDQQFCQIGKLLIAFFIHKAEIKTPIGFHSPDWIQFLVEEYWRNSRSLKKFIEMPPKIFTFNYDTFFETSFFEHLNSHHKKEFSTEYAKEIVSGLNIQHIYGKIGTFAWNQETTSEVDFYRQALEQIKVIGEERNQSQLDNVAKEFVKSLEDADKVYFLGFGFDELNTKLLFRHYNKYDELRYTASYYSTNFKLTNFDVQRLQQRIPVQVNFYQQKDLLGNVDCLNLLAEREPVFIEKDDFGANTDKMRDAFFPRPHGWMS